MKFFKLLLVGALVVAAADLALIQPSELVARLAARPAIFQVGFAVLYRSKHIPSAIYAGPGSKAEGLEALRAAVAQLPKDREIVIYCGCCPWDECPNIKPSLEALRAMGFTRVKALYLPENFKTDWLDKGYAYE